jgi:hypothetical protein
MSNHTPYSNVGAAMVLRRRTCCAATPARRSSNSTSSKIKLVRLPRYFINVLGIVQGFSSAWVGTGVIWYIGTYLPECLLKKYPFPQCCGSVTYWYRSGSADPYLWQTDPDSIRIRLRILLFSSVTFKMARFLKIHFAAFSKDKKS